MADTPKSMGFRMPAEWDEHEGTWLSWPHNPRTWVGNFGPIPQVFVEIVRALCPNENVHIAVRDAASEASVRHLLKENYLDGAALHFYHIPTNDAWARDHGPIFIRNTGEDARATGQLAVVDWNFNSWGGKYPPWDDDDAVPDRVADFLA